MIQVKSTILKNSKVLEMAKNNGNGSRKVTSVTMAGVTDDRSGSETGDGSRDGNAICDNLPVDSSGEVANAGNANANSESNVRDRSQEDFSEHRDREAERRETVVNTEASPTPNAVLESPMPTPTAPKTPATPASVTPAAPAPGAAPFKLGEVSVWDGRTAVICKLFPDASIAVAVQCGDNQLPEVIRLTFPRPSEATADAPEPVDPLADALSRGERVPMAGMTVAYIHSEMDPIFEHLFVYRAKIVEVISASVLRLVVFESVVPPKTGPDITCSLPGIAAGDRIERLNGVPRPNRWEYTDCLPLSTTWPPQRHEEVDRNLIACPKCGAGVPRGSIVTTEIGSESLRACVTCTQRAGEEFVKLLDSAIASVKA